MDESLVQRLAARAARKSDRPTNHNGSNHGFLRQSSEPSLLTPLTHSRALEQIRERARGFENVGDFAKALEIYRGALALVGDDERVLRRIAMLKEKMRSLSGKENDQDEEEYTPNADDNEPATVEKKKKTTKKRSSSSSGEKKTGSYTKSKKVKSVLDDLEVDAAVQLRLLARVNSGSLDELCALHAVGRKRAGELVEKRPFLKLTDLPFGPKTLDAFVKKNMLIE